MYSCYTRECFTGHANMICNCLHNTFYSAAPKKLHKVQITISMKPFKIK